ncbi:MAG: AAA family ATPase [Patescibacteria group bacterium]|mgnify:CR=1 FL=1
MASKELLPIRETDIAPYRSSANVLLQSVKWRPIKDVASLAKGGGASGSDRPAWRESTAAPTIEKPVSIMKSAARIANDPVIFPEQINRALLALRKGLQMGGHLSELYDRASGLALLREQNQRGKLPEVQSTEFHEKTATYAAISIFVAAYYVVWMIESMEDDIGAIPVNFQGIPELPFKNRVDALSCVMYYYGAYLEDSGSVMTEKEFLKMTLVYFRAVLEELKLRLDSFKHSDAFTCRHYKLEGSEFTVSGFDVEHVSGGSVEFRRVEFNEIVGNRDAKHAGRRLIDRLACYDPTVKKNPMFELGGFVFLTLGHGKPGTGKSMQIAAIATALADRCQWLGLRFKFHPLPETIVSTFQGGSAEHMDAYMRAFSDPMSIVYGAIDDAENTLEERTRQGVSAGVREVIGVFLRRTEGASAVQYGNAVIHVCTNIPDQIDKAVLSRIQSRTMINGATTATDFLDQDYLWWRRYHALDPAFVGMLDPSGYAYLSAQGELTSLSQISATYTEPKEASIREVYETALTKHQPNEQMFFAEFYAGVLARYPEFSSRDVRNIQKAVDARVMDFDFPADWLDSPETFYRREYARKVAMIRELMQVNMRGLSFAEIRLQETFRYLDSMVRIQDAGYRREVEREAERLRIAVAAHQLVGEKAR